MKALRTLEQCLTLDPRSATLFQANAIRLRRFAHAIVARVHPISCFLGSNASLATLTLAKAAVLQTGQPFFRVTSRRVLRST